jgi:uncharacterized membrane protein
MTAQEVKQVIDLALPHFGERVDLAVDKLREDLQAEYGGKIEAIDADVRRLKNNQGKALVGFGAVSLVVGSIWGIVWDYTKNKARSALGLHL